MKYFSIICSILLFSLNSLAQQTQSGTLYLSGASINYETVENGWVLQEENSNEFKKNVLIDYYYDDSFNKNNLNVVKKLNDNIRRNAQKLCTGFSYTKETLVKQVISPDEFIVTTSIKVDDIFSSNSNLISREICTIKITFTNK